MVILYQCPPKDKERKMSDRLMDAIAKYNKARAALMGVGTNPVKRPKNDAPTMTSALTPNQYCVDLGNWLYKHYGYSGRVEIRQRLSRSYHTTRKGQHVLRFGMQSTTRAFNEGFLEYKRVCQYTGLPRYTKGWAGVRQLILHEFAHVLTKEDGARKRGSAHNFTFIRRYRELMTLVP
jgi:hypothetical protein